MKLNILISAAALLLVCAAPGALASNMRGADAAAALALGTTNHGEGAAVESNPFDNYASRGQGGDDSNGNPCYCNDPKIRKSKKLCLDGYTCENHKCEGSGPRPDRASCKDEKILKVAEGGSCNKQKECVASCNCDDGICRSEMTQQKEKGPASRVPEGGKCSKKKECVASCSCAKGICRSNTSTPVRLPVPEGSVCGASSGGVCFPDLDCLGGICARPLVAEGEKCDRKSECVASCRCDDGTCRPKEIQPAGEGGACNVYDGPFCSDDLKCKDGICRAPDTFNAPADTDRRRPVVWHVKSPGWKYCVKNCPVSTADPCCGGEEKARHLVGFPSRDSCCAQSALSWDITCVAMPYKCIGTSTAGGDREGEEIE